MITGATGDVFYARGITGADPGSRYNIVRLGTKLKDPDDHAFLGYMAVYGGKRPGRRPGHRRPKAGWT